MEGARGRGCMLTSELSRAGGGYPTQSFFERTHCVHAGRFSSHLIRLFLLNCQWADTGNLGARAASYLQLLHPVLTFGLLVRTRLDC